MRHHRGHHPFGGFHGRGGFGGRHEFGGRGEFGGHGGGFRGERRGGRFFEQGDLRWVVLQLIAEQPRHGYEIIKEIGERMGGGYSPSPGVIYPTLTLLEELGYVAVADADGARKLYNLTDEGRAQLEAQRAAVDALFEKMRSIRERSAGGAPAPVTRAIENLKTAIRLKLEQGPLSDEQARAVAEALDTAALSVERA